VPKPSARQANGGRLTIFFGAAPGVGKTRTMLREAVRRQHAGAKVVVAALEERSDWIDDICRDLVCVPPRRDGSGGATVDLDAVLGLAPDLVVVDEMQRRNGPTSRHFSRCREVEEILAKGADVYTTLNAAHLESLRDLVISATGIEPVETVPDRLFDRADDIVYVARDGEEGGVGQSEAASEEGFENALGESLREPGTLARLEEIAKEKRFGTGSGGAFAAPPRRGTDAVPPAGRIMAVVRPDIDVKRMVRNTRRLADAQGSAWSVVGIIQPAHGTRDQPAEEELKEALTLARSLGANTELLVGYDLYDQVIALARSGNVTELVLPRPRHGWFQRLLRRSWIHRLIDAAAGIRVNIIDVPGNPTFRSSREWRFRPEQPWFHEYLASAAAVFLAAGVVKTVSAASAIDVHDLSILMLAAVLFSAISFGLVPSVFSAVLGVLVHNFFFVDPNLRLQLGQEIVNLAMFLGVAGLTSHFVWRLREQAESARRREVRTGAMLRLSREVAAAGRFDDAVKAIVEQVNAILQVEAVLLLPRHNSTYLDIAYPTTAMLTGDEREAAEWAFDFGDQAGRGTETLSSAHRLYHPLQTANGTCGVLGLEVKSTSDLNNPNFRNLLEALSGIAADAVERIRLTEEIGRTRVIAETESLRSALLSSVSHDLRTPLASIIGSASSLGSYGDYYDEPTKKELLQTIYEEADRLNRFVGNLLEMTKLESGALVPRRQWIDADDLIGTALDDMRRNLGQGHEIVTEVEPGLPLLFIDLALMEQVIVNLLDNAIKYSPPGTRIRLRAFRDRQRTCIEVVDEGVGIPKEMLDEIFDKFFRLRHRDRRMAGTGLGLAICKGIVEAHGGSIEAASAGDGKGSVFRVRLPIEAPQPVVSAEEVEVG